VLRFGARAAFVFCICFVVVASPAFPAQDKPKKGDDANTTDFLVARRDLGDPLFKESVVFMLPSSLFETKEPVVGLIINRPGRVALSEIFPDDKDLKDRSEMAYFGGPVDTRSPSLIFRSSRESKGAQLLFDDVYISFDQNFVENAIKKPGDKTDLRLFLGRSQWSAEQLQDEVVRGAWYSLRAETKLIFSADPKYMWLDLLGRANPAPVA
jgi:putative transcriptional regulator